MAIVMLLCAGTSDLWCWARWCSVHSESVGVAGEGQAQPAAGSHQRHVSFPQAEEGRGEERAWDEAGVKGPWEGRGEGE